MQLKTNMMQLMIFVYFLKGFISKFVFDIKYFESCFSFTSNGVWRHQLQSKPEKLRTNSYTRQVKFVCSIVLNNQKSFCCFFLLKKQKNKVCNVVEVDYVMIEMEIDLGILLVYRS